MPTPNSDPDEKNPRPMLVLASASPRRSEILTGLGVPFEIRPSEIEERTRPGEPPPDLAVRLAREKCLEVAARLAEGPRRPVLGADTIVVVDGDVLGKPRDAEHAVELLSRLMGRTHEVMTGIAVAWSDAAEANARVFTSQVEMRPASRAELVEYVAVGESLDKAGGYAIQGAGARFVRGVTGSRSNVIGLPDAQTLALLRECGVDDTVLGR